MAVPLSCGAKCAKLIVLIINFIFTLIGLTLLGFGLFLVIDIKAMQNKYFLPLGPSVDQVIIAAGIILVVGACVFLVSVIGCCATIKEHTGCLTFYSVILVFLLILQVAAVIIAAVFYDQIMSTLDQKMNNIVKYQYGQQDQSTKFIDEIQKTMCCCGVSNGPEDWNASDYHHNTTNTVPESCCIKNGTSPINVTLCRDLAYDTQNPNRTTYIYTEGCESKLDHEIKGYVGVIIGVIVGIVVLQIIFIIITCLLKKSIAVGYEYV